MFLKKDSKQNDSNKKIEEKDIEATTKATENLDKEKEGKPKNWQEEAEKHLDGWKRCQADFDNYKKRQKELQWELAKYSGLNLILQILPILDNFHAATNHIPQDQKDNPWVIGIMYIQKQLEKILEDNGVKEVKTKVGDDFDPQIHEAVHNGEQKKKEDSKDKIFKVVLKGYQMEEKIIRAARVIVG